jgi:hypothetical protein
MKAVELLETDSTFKSINTCPYRSRIKVSIVEGKIEYIDTSTEERIVLHQLVKFLKKDRKGEAYVDDDFNMYLVPSGMKIEDYPDYTDDYNYEKLGSWDLLK